MARESYGDGQSEARATRGQERGIPSGRSSRRTRNTVAESSSPARNTAANPKAKRRKRTDTSVAVVGNLETWFSATDETDSRNKLKTNTPAPGYKGCTGLGERGQMARGGAGRKLAAHHSAPTCHPPRTRGREAGADRTLGGLPTPPRVSRANNRTLYVTRLQEN